MSDGSQQSLAPSYDGIVLPISSYLAYDDWEIEQGLRHIARRLGKDLPGRPTWPGDRLSRVDAAHEPIPPSHWGQPEGNPNTHPVEYQPKKWGSLLLYGGLMPLICGTVLLTWSYLTDRQDLQLWGWPCLLLGQAALILGMLWQATLGSRTKTSRESSSPEGGLKSSPLVPERTTGSGPSSLPEAHRPHPGLKTEPSSPATIPPWVTPIPGLDQAHLEGEHHSPHLWGDLKTPMDPLSGQLG